MRWSIAGLTALLLVCGGAGEAEAGLVYDNGPINGSAAARLINLGDTVTNSFTRTSPTTLASAQVGLWLELGDSPASVHWSIGTSKFASDVSSGTSSTTNVFQFTNTFFGQHFDIYESTFSLSATLGAGTYWLTLDNATTAGSLPLGWDQNDGPSTAFNNFGPIPSESFQLYDNRAAIPEPGSFVPMGLGALGLLAYGWRRRS